MQANQRQPACWLQYGFLALAAAFLYLDLFVLPATPIAGTDLDEAFYLHNAARMLDGQMIYRDFFQFTPPGTELVYFSLFKLFGVRAWIPNAAQLVLGLGITWLCIYISRKIVSGPTAYLPAILFLVLSFHSAMDGSHHWFSMFLVIAAVALIIQERSVKRLAWAATLCGLASFFTQTRGVGTVVAIALFLWWEHRNKPRSVGRLLKTEAVLAAVFTAVTLVLNLYFVWEAGLKHYLWCTITFAIKYYPAESQLNSFQISMLHPPWVNHWRFVPEPGWVIIHAAVPFIYLLFFVHCWRQSGKRPDQPWDRLMLISLVGLFLFLGVASAPNAWRMCIVSLPGLIVLGWYLSSAGKLRAVSRWALCLGTVAAMMSIVWNQQTRWRACFETPTGPAAFFDSADYQEYKWVASHTHSSDKFFDCTGKSYFLLGLRSPAMVSFLSDTDYMRPEQVRDLVENLEGRRVQVVRWCPDLDTSVRADDHLGPLREYLFSNYRDAEVPENPGRVLVRIEAGPRR
jgi:hypothetical protein